MLSLPFFSRCRPVASFLAAAACLTLLLHPEAARAEVALTPANAAGAVKPPSPLGFEMSAVVQAPLFVGGQATLELPGRLLITGEGGVLPSAFIDAIDSGLTGAGVYGEAVSSFVRGMNVKAEVGRLSLGWRPFSGHGLELHGGYTYVSLHGTLSERLAQPVVTSMVPAAGAYLSLAGDLEVPFRSNLHCVHAALSWRWVIADHVVVRLSAAYVQSVASSSGVDGPFTFGDRPAVQAALTTAGVLASEKLGELYSKYAKLPLLGLSVGYRF